MELTGLFPIIRRWLGVILVATAVATGVGLLLGVSAEKTYEARAEMLVGPLSTDSDTMRASGDLAQTYAQLATSNSVMTTAAKELDLPRSELKTGVRATANSTTRFLVVRARSHSAKDAAAIANAVSLQLIELGKQDPTRPEGQLRVIDPATPPSQPVSPRTDLIVPLAALAGLLGSLTLVLLFEFVGDTAESVEKVDALTGVPTLAVKRIHDHGGTAERSGTLEPYRIIATQIDLAAPDVRCVLITGVTTDDGTAGLALRLAAVRAHRRSSVSLLDSTTGEITILTGPSLATRRANGQGLPDQLADPEALTTEGAIAQLDQLEGPGGLLVVHGQPATLSAATLVWARVADVTVLSVRRFQARRSTISDAVVNLQAVGANLALSVLHERPGPIGRTRRGTRAADRGATNGRQALDPQPPAIESLPADDLPSADDLRDDLIGSASTEDRPGGGSSSRPDRRRRAGSATTGSGTQR